MKQYALVESPALKFAKISIKPFISKDDNTGLKEFNMVVHEGIRHIDIIVCKSDKGRKIYKTGLNEFDESVATIDQVIPGESKEEIQAKKEEKAARIKTIRELIVRAENELAGNFEIAISGDGTVMNEKGEFVSIEKIAPDYFYSKVHTFKSIITDTVDEKGNRRETFWDTFQLELDNDGIILDENYVRDLLIVNAIEAGGFSMVAPDYETALENSKYYKFYLDKRSQTAGVKIAPNMLRDEAGAKLFNLYKNDMNKLFYITKLVSYDSDNFKTGKNATPNEILYQECTNFLEGKLHMNMTEAATEFLKYANMDMKDLKPRIFLKDGRSNKFIMMKDGVWYFYATQTPLGKTDAECIEFLKNDANSTIFAAIEKKLKTKWTE